MAAKRDPQYPDGMHPGLIRGISVEEQRYEFGVDKVVFGVAAALILAFIGWGVYNPDSVSTTANAAFAWGMEHAGWLFNIVMFVCLVLVVVIAFTRMARFAWERTTRNRNSAVSPGSR